MILSFQRTCLFFLLILSCWLKPDAYGGMTNLARWTGQLVYVPLYSHIYADKRYGDKPFLLTATLSIRNTDPENAITLHQVDFYDSEGNLIKHYLKAPLSIQPLGSMQYIVHESENQGGSGAKFLVSWKTKKDATQPIIESISIGTKMQQGISFISRGIVIKGESIEE
ncbi:DUF3124 domain-containing protein [Desulfogranum japonicum]|uniref:DUF3124 domain-containing protein n=1 Tax=Desulfogranum japonicum TaxID=231447 RepID=UPI00040D689E|nr:DUF3124 domain-containing protein [Desulfogranum japonicum]